MRKLVRRILRSAGLGCVEAADGESGLELAVEAGVSAAIVDLFLPDMSGAELAWRLREEIPGLPVVGVSEHLDLWDPDDLADLGIRELLPKSFEVGNLVRAVADALASSPERRLSRLHQTGARRSARQAAGPQQEKVHHGTH